MAVGKDGYVYLLNRDNLGGIRPGTAGSDNVVQRIGPYGGVWSRPGVWPGDGGWVYIPTVGRQQRGGLVRQPARLQVRPLGHRLADALAAGATSPDAFGFGSGAPVITSDGTTSGSALVWTVWSANGGGRRAAARL